MTIFGVMDSFEAFEVELDCSNFELAWPLRSKHRTTRRCDDHEASY